MVTLYYGLLFIFVSLIIINRNIYIFIITLDPSKVFTPESLFSFDDEVSPARYRGTETVRGILCDRWDANFNRTWSSRSTETTYNYVLSSYFSVPQWNFRGNTQQVSKRLYVFIFFFIIKK